MPPGKLPLGQRRRQLAAAKQICIIACLQSENASFDASFLPRPRECSWWLSAWDRAGAWRDGDCRYGGQDMGCRYGGRYALLQPGQPPRLHNEQESVAGHKNIFAAGDRKAIKICGVARDTATAARSLSLLFSEIAPAAANVTSPKLLQLQGLAVQPQGLSIAFVRPLMRGGSLRAALDQWAGARLPHRRAMSGRRQRLCRSFQARRCGAWRLRRTRRRRRWQPATPPAWCTGTYEAVQHSFGRGGRCGAERL